jgi:hypothetical protein
MKKKKANLSKLKPKKILPKEDDDNNKSSIITPNFDTRMSDSIEPEG